MINDMTFIERKAHERALYLLGYRDHCYTELYKKLEKTYDEEIARKTCDKMVKIGFVDDVKYATKLAINLIFTKRFGLRKVKWDMMQKGLSRELVEEVLEEYEYEDATARIAQLIERKYARYLTDEKGVNKVTNALARMGHNYADIKRAISDYIENGDNYGD